MIVFTTERCEGACVVHVDGFFEPSDDPTVLVQRFVDESGANPLVVDLSGVEPPTGAKVTTLLQLLAVAPKRETTVLVHPDLETRRLLRAQANGLPVVPSSDLVAMKGCRSASLFALRSALRIQAWSSSPLEVTKRASSVLARP